MNSPSHISSRDIKLGQISFSGDLKIPISTCIDEEERTRDSPGCSEESKLNVLQ